MILIDFNQIVVSSVFSTKDDDETEYRNKILRAIKASVMRFGDVYKNVTICCDSGHSWRKDFFPYYKCRRKINRKKSPVNWTAIHRLIGEMRDEIRDNFPYRVIQIEGAEADDIIAVIATKLAKEGERVIIVSSDKDFQQLQKFPQVKQWSPKRRDFIRQRTPEKYLKEHVLRGDKDDDIPNILSDDKTYALGLRSGSVTRKRMDLWTRPDYEFETEEMKRNWIRNSTLIDFEMIPDKVKSQVLEEFETLPVDVTQRNTFEYLSSKRLKQLIGTVGEFY